MSTATTLEFLLRCYIEGGDVPSQPSLPSGRVGERAPRRSQEYGGNHTVGFAFDLREASESRKWDGYPTV